MKNWVLIFIIFFIIASVCFTGCSEKNQGKTVNNTVLDFLYKVNETRYESAFSYYSGDMYPYPEVLKQIFRDEGFIKDGIAEINLENQDVNKDVAVVTAHCRITDFNLNRQRINPSEKDIHFKLEKENNMWVITDLSFKEPYILPGKKSENMVASVSDSKTSDDDDNYALYIFLIVISILGILIYFNKKSDSKSSEDYNVDFSDTYPLQKESLSRFVKLVPSNQNEPGKKSTIDVWVKNSSKTPYENFRIIAVHNNSMKVKNPNLNFGTIEPGQTVKQTWEVKPEVSGMVSIKKPTVVFEYMGEKYAGVLDPLWIQVQ